MSGMGVAATVREEVHVSSLSPSGHTSGHRLSGQWPIPFPPNRGLLVCDDTAVRQISRLSSAPFVGAPQETSRTPGLNGPRNLKPDTSPLASNGMRHGPCLRHGRGVGSEP